MEAKREAATRPPVGPAELVLTASVARRYYLNGRSKVEIAEEFAISRFKVARLLDAARSSGLVRIEIDWPGDVDVEASTRLREGFGLTHSVVVNTHETNPVQVRRQLGAVAARLLEEIVTADDVLGLAWARSVSAMTTALRRLAPAPVVQLTGALAGADAEDSSIELVRDVATLSGGTAYLFFAPLVVADPATARALRRQPDVARAFRQFDSVTKAVAGVGLWAPGHSTVFDALGQRDRAGLLREGVLADVSGILLDANGGVVDSRLTERTVGIAARRMAAIPEVVAIVYDEVKAPAVHAALRSGLVNALVTHTALADALLALR